MRKLWAWMDRDGWVRSSLFFRITLLRLTTEEQITKFLRRYENDQKALRKQIVDIMWYMRGGLSREEAWTLSPSERLDVWEMVEERMEIVKESKLPLI